MSAPLAIPLSPRSVAMPPFLSSPEGMLPTPGDFPAFRLCTSSSTSALSTVGFQLLVCGSGYSGVD